MHEINARLRRSRARKRATTFSSPARSARLEFGSSHTARLHSTKRGRFSPSRCAGSKEGGADFFLLETFADMQEIEQAILAAREVDPKMPVIAQMTIGTDCLTPYGASAEDIAKALDAFGADVIGLNCSVGPQIILDAIEKMVKVTRKKLSAQPNAGMPREVSGRSMYMASPEYMATYARHLVQAGAKIVGGCCGTTPEHIAAIVEGIRPLVPAAGARAEARTAPGRADAVLRDDKGVEPMPFAERSKFGGKIARGEFVTSVEIVPPRGVDASKMLRDTQALKEAGVDAVNVPDGPRAQSRMGALLTSSAHRAAGRNRNRHALLLPRSQPPRHALRSARRIGDRAAQHAASSPAIRRRWVRIRMRRPCSTSTRSVSRISSTS